MTREPERREFPSFSHATKVAWGLGRFVALGLTVRLHGLPEKRGTDLSNWVVLTIVSSWQKSYERRRRRGRAQHRETGAACRSETQRGATPEARVIARPMEGALDHQYLRHPLHGRTS